ncbi:MAG: trypsin-like serine protease [Rhodobacteraceae bacterium]|nr:trypsin-like serine protease [Paracoccaceae bacterium]
MMRRAAPALAAAFALVQGPAAAIEAGLDVPDRLASATGAVRGGGCSGMLVTPWWVLTAGHCGMVTAVTLAGDTRSVARNLFHPRFNAALPASPEKARFDVQLLALSAPVFPVLPDRTVWETYRRDLYRGDPRRLPDTAADIFGYGGVRNQKDGEDTFSGVLRYGEFRIESIEEVGGGGRILNMDGRDRGEQFWQGDSGSAVLWPGRSYEDLAPGNDYVILGVGVQYFEIPLIDTETRAALATEFAPWFDATLGPERTSLGAPSLIVTALPLP